MSKKIHNVRRWLNPKDHSDSGLVHMTVDVDGTPAYPYVDAGMDIWDCSRKITLDFSFSNEKEAKQRVEKIDILIQELENLKAVLGVAFDATYEAMYAKEEEEHYDY